MKIGNVRLSNPLVLAPMSGVSDHWFRALCKEHGAGLVCTEMVNQLQIIRAHEAKTTFQGKTELQIEEFIERLKITKKERPTSVQLFGQNPGGMAKAAQLIEKQADIIDVNLGCPSHKLTEGTMGSKLLLYPDKIGRILKEMTSTLKVPVTAKMRLGYHNKDNVIRIAKICEKAGASAIAVHGRTTTQGYSGEADWRSIIKIKESVGIPVIGNGDITTVEIASKRLEQVDAIMLGRITRGNPFIFSRILHYLKTNEVLPEPNREDKIQAYIRYLELSGKRQTRGLTKYEIRMNNDFKLQAHSFMNGFPGCVEIRKKIGEFKTSDELLEYLKSQ